jgi:hypothetical protein
MMAALDLKRTLKSINPTLRRQFFSAWPALAGLDWAQMVKARDVDPLLEGLRDLTSDDHVVPIQRGGALLDESNLQSLCRACHNRKTAMERKR